MLRIRASGNVTKFQFVFGLILLSVNLCITLWGATRYLSLRKAAQRVYSYSGRDFPLELPVTLPDKVAMTFQESVHYSLNASDPSSIEEWRTLYAEPLGRGRAWMGDNQRMLLVGFFHDLHCLTAITEEFEFRGNKSHNFGHLHHCIGYLRQSFLCDADETLESGDFMLRNFEIERTADTAVCNDWETAFSFLGSTFEHAVDALAEKFGDGAGSQGAM